jgi:hypothetical protein
MWELELSTRWSDVSLLLFALASWMLGQLTCSVSIIALRFPEHWHCHCPRPISHYVGSRLSRVAFCEPDQTLNNLGSQRQNARELSKLTPRDRQEPLFAPQSIDTSVQGCRLLII